MNQTRKVVIVFLLLQFILPFGDNNGLFEIEPAYAQSVTAQPVTGGGINGVLFQTRSGQIRVNLPDDTSAGDTISGTVVLEPKGRSEGEQDRNEDTLNGYVVEVADQKAPANLGDFTCLMPQATNLITLVLKDKKGTPVCTQPVNINPTPPPLPNAKYPGTCMLPPCGQATWPVQIRGPCDGKFSTSSVKIDGKEATKLCESPRKIVAECPNIYGATSIELQECGNVAKAPFTCLALTLKCGQASIQRGKTTTLGIYVQGLDKITEPVTLQINNRSPNVIQLEGGDRQEVQLTKQTGVYQLTRQVNAIRTGGFSIAAWILEPKIINVTRFAPMSS